MPISSQIVGRTSEEFRDEVSDRWVMNYAAAVNDFNPVYLDNRGTAMPAHPAYVSQLEWQPLFQVLQAASESAGMSGAESARGVHSFNDTKMPRAIHSGDELCCTATIVGVEQRRSGARVSFDITTTNQHDEVVAVSRTVTVFRDVEVRDEPVTPPAWDATAVGLGGSPSREETIALGPLAAHVFSECARDYNPMHTDISVATAAGLPGLILHGTGTFAYALTSLTNHEGGGVPASVRRIRGRLGAMVLCPSEMVLRVYADPTSASCFGFQVLNERAEPAIDDGLIEFGPAESSGAAENAP